MQTTNKSDSWQHAFLKLIKCHAVAFPRHGHLLRTSAFSRNIPCLLLGCLLHSARPLSFPKGNFKRSRSFFSLCARSHHARSHRNTQYDIEESDITNDHLCTRVLSATQVYSAGLKPNLDPLSSMVCYKTCGKHNLLSRKLLGGSHPRVLDMNLLC